MNAQHRINKRNARLRRIQKEIDWWTIRVSSIFTDEEKKRTEDYLNRLNNLKALLEKEP